jgi:hypothetical protein
MTTLSYPLFLDTQASFATSQLKMLLLEPLFVAFAGLFWLTVLPIGAFISAAIATYEKIAAFHSTGLRLPLLRSNAATSPLVFKRTGVALCQQGPGGSSPHHVLRA